MPGTNKRWEDEENEEEESSSAESSTPATAAIPTRRKFDDEEAEDSDVLDSWDAAEDSEVEREKAKKAAEVKAKAEAEAAAKKKSKTQRMAERIAEHKQAKEEDDESSEEEDPAAKRERLRRIQKEADLHVAEDLFADVGTNVARKATGPATVVVVDAKDPTRTIDLANVPVFNPVTKAQFEQMRQTLVPLLGASSKRAQYSLFLQEFCKQIAKELPSDQIKKIASSLTALSNEKMKEEKAAEKGGKKSKAAKTKTSLAGVSRGGDVAADTKTYEDDFGDDDFM